ncbi:hypothetical protein A33Q_3237 [Indibacter alkaliphilus LW1]|uniref:Uncharacterized protein n=1 Tax=Indibacter alkaliphilus (strain CCUG 57479 / KCTC 22604 / LW1) TaxID=1189612 RepID=S2DFN5_INDAL|nr:hypothetical protein A33Q_3237 [Indibacter alkaliphilus LW1]
MKRRNWLENSGGEIGIVLLSVSANFSKVQICKQCLFLLLVQLWKSLNSTCSLI